MDSSCRVVSGRRFVVRNVLGAEIERWASHWVHSKEKLCHLYEVYYCPVCQFYFWKDKLETGSLSCESKCMQVLWETGMNRLLFKSFCPSAYHYYEAVNLPWIESGIFLNPLLLWCLSNRHGRRKHWQISRRVWSNCQQLVRVVVPDFSFCCESLENMLMRSVTSYAEISEHSNIYSCVAWYMLYLWQKDFYWAFTEWDGVSYYLIHIWPD